MMQIKQIVFVNNINDINIISYNLIINLCEFCKYNDTKKIDVCSKYPSGKPIEVMNGQNCSKFDNRKNII